MCGGRWGDLVSCKNKKLSTVVQSSDEARRPAMALAVN